MPPQEDKQFAASDRSVEEQAVSSVWLEELLQYLSTDERAILHKLYFQDILEGRKYDAQIILLDVEVDWR